MSDMDRIIERPWWQNRKLIWGAGAAVFAGALIWLSLSVGGERTFRADPERLSIATVTEGSFRDFIPIRGNVQPMDSVYLDAIEGGQVQEIFVEEGANVEAGDAILRFANSQLQLNVISRQAQVTEQLNVFRNTELNLEQNRLNLRREEVEIDFQLTKLTREVRQKRELYSRGVIPEDTLLDVEDEYDYYQRRKEVNRDSLEFDERTREARLEQTNAGIALLERNLEVVQQTYEALLVRAPVAGRLTSLDAEIGESKQIGDRLGQIDDVSTNKVTALVDEFYISRVMAGQTATFNLSGNAYTLSVAKIYAEVKNGQFEIDLDFAGDEPTAIRRGQTFQIQLELGSAQNAMLIPNGGFYQDTGGDWIFVLDEDGGSASKRDITIGRRNPRFIEVRDGLRAGEQVIVSEYAGMADMDRITLD